jgi:hypothetical protein
VERLGGIPGIAAVVLGGSHASGSARPDSDVDLGLYYREAAPFSIDAVRRLANAANDTPHPTVTDFGGWGQWVNGGAWLTVQGQRVDLIYRNADKVQRVVHACAAGNGPESDYYVQHIWGWHSHIYLGELAICRPLYDPDGLLADLKAQVAVYPAALKADLIRTWLSCADTFYTARKTARAGDVYGTVGCLTRTDAMLTQVLFALNETYFVSDKGSFARLDTFPLRPPDYCATVTSVLAAPGTTSEALLATVERMAEIHQQVADLCREWLSPSS